ncbi:MAG: copper chaperone [Sphingobacteriales bacterium]|nr:MAG: copper chaperone [Sphingobacteriales bacterium]
MKYIVLCLLTMMSSIVGQAQIIKAELTATGLTCSMCSRATYKQLTSIPEVENVDTDLNNTAFIIHFKKGSKVNIADLREKVEAAGFSIGELLLTMRLGNQQSANNSSFLQDNIKYTFMDSKNTVLTGDVQLKVLDKGFVVDKEYKKLLKMAKQFPGYAAGNPNTYHVKTM